ncbi:hypothetical protein GMO_03480 [Gluconobacter morbifer G707]|uniref:Uncharacterized protein n=2 Tax=Gluconobacter TaxID=441 RepID=G6XFT3_9PROT|nr:hypothetical protein GMO_03480 [Gluconobacter morbifer G707]
MAVSVLLPALTPASAASRHARHTHGTAGLPAVPPSAAQTFGKPDEKPLTPAQQVALPDGGAPAPPHGYTVTEDSDATLASFSDTVHTHLPLGMPGTNAQQKTNGTNNLPSHFSILGMPVKFNAPVRPPYESEDTPANYAGHPSNGQTDILVNGDSSPIH